MTLDVNYTLDLTTQFTALNRISIVARFDLGDMGRASRAATVDSLYIGGLEAYAANDLEKAIELWTKALDIDPFFDPAREARTNAVASLELQQRILDLQRLE
jgi:tetratricopeptide (TPR) repeat protein